MSVKRTITELERYRRLRGLSITDLAREIGRSRPYVSRVEGGYENPSPGFRRDVAEALGVPEDVIFGERELV
jgi:transcriptional regulator with XRE-family HTH domain